MNETVSGRIDMLNSINTAVQKVSAKPIGSKQYRISDLLLWMQAWSDDGETTLVSVESTDKFDNSTLAVDCSDEEFRSIVASFYQVLHRTAANAPLRKVQQTQGQKGFEAWHAIVRRYDQRNTSDTKISICITETKTWSKFDDILRTFINETNKFENRFGTIRDEEPMLAVKKLMLESSSNYRFRGTTMSYSELLVAPENIIIDNVATVPTARNSKIDTSAPMDIGMAAKDDGQIVSEEGDQRVVDLALQAVYKETGKGTLSFGNGQSWNEKGFQGGKGGKDRWRGERTHGRRAVARKEARSRRKVAREKPEHACWTCGKSGHVAAWCRSGGNKTHVRH